jgi:hypothetical protein
MQTEPSVSELISQTLRVVVLADFQEKIYLIISPLASIQQQTFLMPAS